MALIGKWLGIQCFKHDGTLHRMWDRGLVLENNDDYIVVATKKAKVTEYNGRRWFTKEPAVTIFSKKEWWNAICMIKKDGVSYYCNIASPCLINNGLIKYIDYDLDVKLFPNGDIKTLDEKEYMFNANKYGYSDELNDVLRFETDEIIEKMKSNVYPFDSQKIEEYYKQFNEMVDKE